MLDTSSQPCPEHHADIGQGCCPFPSRGCKDTCQHGYSSLSKYLVFFLSLVKELCCSGIQSVFSGLPLQRVVRMPDASRVKHIDWPKQASKSGCLCK